MVLLADFQTRSMARPEQRLFLFIDRTVKGLKPDMSIDYSKMINDSDVKRIRVVHKGKVKIIPDVDTLFKAYK
jgi:hypothetical protein